MGKFRDPMALSQFLGALLGVLVAFNLGVTDEQAALWLAAIMGAVAAVNAVFVRPIAPALITGAVTALADLVGGYGFEIGAEKLSAVNLAIAMGLAFFFVRPNSTLKADPAAGQGVPEKVATDIRTGSPVI